MRQRYRVFVTPAIILFILTFLVFRTSGSKDIKSGSSAECCKKETSPCNDPDKEKSRGDDLILENLSRQFISTTMFN